MAASCLLSCAFLIIGLATAPHSRSATIVAARYNSCSEGVSSFSSQGNISLSAIFSMTLAIFSRALSSSCCDIRGGNLLFFSIVLTTFGGTPARPMSLSTAKGGQADIRSVGNTSGLVFSSSTPTSVRFLVALRVTSTSFVVCIRVVLYASGANCMNQSLYISTDSEMSFFHLSGLSLLIAITQNPGFVTDHNSYHPAIISR